MPGLAPGRAFGRLQETAGELGPAGERLGAVPGSWDGGVALSQDVWGREIIEEHESTTGGHPNGSGLSLMHPEHPGCSSRQTGGCWGAGEVLLWGVSWCSREALPSPGTCWPDQSHLERQEPLWWGGKSHFLLRDLRGLLLLSPDLS